MADTDLSLTLSVDSTAAVDGVAAVNTALEQTATDAQAAGTAAAAARQAVVDGTAAAAPAVSAVDQAAQQLTATMANLNAALANPNSGPRVLMRDSAQAQLALMQFKQAAADAGVSTEAMGVQVEAAGQKILEASTKAATFTVELGKVRAAGMEAANQLQTLQGHGTTLTGMFGEMIKTGTPLESFLGKLGSYGALAVIGFEAAKMAGERLGAGLTALAGAHLDLIDAQRREQDMLAATGLQLQAVAKGAMDMGGSVAEMTANWNNYLLAQGRGTQAMKDAAGAFIGLRSAQLDYGAQQDKVAAAAALLEGIFQRQALADADLAQKTNALTTVQIANAAAMASGVQTSAQKHDADWRLAQAEDALAASQTTATAAQFASIEAVVKSEASINAYMTTAREMGDVIPAAFRAAIDAAESLRKEHSDLLDMEKNLVAEMKNQIGRAHV